MLRYIQRGLFPLFVYAFCVWSAPANAESIQITIGVSDNLAPRIRKTLEAYPDACDREEFFSAEWLRTTLEFIIACRAVRLGGIEATYAFKSYPNSARTREELKQGSFMIMVDFPWGNFSNDDRFYKTSAVLPVGSFVKGIYTRPDHTELLKVSSVEELRKFTAVSSKTWFYDWDALERMGVNTVHVPQYVQMGEMVSSGRADFLVGEFPGRSDLSQYINGKRFIPVPGVKINLLGSRHIAVSKKARHAKQVFDALQVGLKIMREKGLIQKGYRTSGFFNSSIEDWKVLCCAP